MFLIAVTAVVLVGVAAALIGRAVLIPRIQTSERLVGLGSYGFRPTAVQVEAIEPPATGGLAKWIGDTIGQHLTNVREEDLRRELLAAGMYTSSARALLGYRVLAATLLPALILWIGFGGDYPPVVVVLLAAVMLPAGWMLPITFVRFRAKERTRQVDREVPELIDLLVVTVEAGMGLSGAIRVASDKLRGPLGEEVRLTVQEQTMGLSTHEALTNLLKRTDAPAIRSFVRSIVQGEALGVAVGDILRDVAEEMRKRRRQTAEERAQKAPVKMLFPLAFLIFPSLFVVLLGPSVFELIHALGDLE